MIAIGAQPYASLPVIVDPATLEILLSPWMRVAAFVWGTLWGSFANVLIYRIPRGMSVIRPRSRCGECETPISWYDNVPIVSWLWLRGRCRHCKAKVSPRYLMVELLAGVLSFALYMLYVISPLLAGGGVDGLVSWQLWFVFTLGLVVVTYTDLDVWIIPNEVVLPIAGVGLLVAFFWPHYLGVEFTDALAAALAGYATVWTIRFLYLKFRGVEGMGLGDAKLLLMIGAFQGGEGLAWALGAGAAQGLLVSIPVLLAGRRVANSELRDIHGDDPDLPPQTPDGGIGKAAVPFGPFLALAALEFALVPEQIRGALEGIWGWMLAA